MADTEESVGRGRLLGTAGVQRAADQVETQLKAFATSISALNKRVGVVGGIVGTAQQAWSGKPNGNSYGSAQPSTNGGGGRFGGAQLGVGGAVSSTGSGPTWRPTLNTSWGDNGGSGGGMPSFSQIQESVKTPNGGENPLFTGATGQDGSGRGGRVRKNGGLRDTFRYISNTGQARMEDFVEGDYTSYYLGSVSGMSKKDVSRGLYNGRFGQSYSDVNQYATTLAQSGVRYGTDRWNRVNANVGASAVLNPTLSAASIAGNYQALGSAQTNNYFRMFGINTRPGGDTKGMLSFTQDMLRVSGLNQNMNADQIEENITNANGTLQRNLNRMPLNEDQKAEIVNNARNLMKARAKGVDAQQLTSLAERAQSGDESATQRLKELDVEMGTSVSKLQGLDATKRSRDADQMTGFNQGLGKAADLLSDFNEMMKKVLETTGAGQAGGAVQGFTTGMSGPVSAGASMWGGLSGGIGGALSALGVRGLARGILGRAGGAGGAGGGAGGAGGAGSGLLGSAGRLLGGLGLMAGAATAVHWGGSKIQNALRSKAGDGGEGFQWQDAGDIAATTGKWAGAGAAAGATAGVLGGPFAPVTIPVGAAIGATGGTVIGAGKGIFDYFRGKNGAQGGDDSNAKQTDGNKGAGKTGRIKFIRPAPGPVTARFNQSGQHWKKKHTGIDFGCGTGTAVKAGADGTVVHAGSGVSWAGNYVIIDHGNNVQTWYCHLSAPGTSVGRKVTTGQTIGLSGATGNVTGPHLHFEVHVNGTPVNPEGYLSGAGGAAGASSEPAKAAKPVDATNGPSTGSTDSTKGFAGASAAGGGAGYGSVSEADAVAAALSNTASAWSGSGNGSGDTGTGASTGSKGKATTTSGTAGSAPHAPSSVSGNKALAKQMAAKMGWTGSQWDALYSLWMKESGFNEHADNPNSSAYGIPQALPGSKMASAGKDWHDNPATQIKWGLGYVKNRYETPMNAWEHSKKTNWYDKGAWRIEQDETARIHKDEMILPAKQAETIRAALLRDSGTDTGGRSGRGVVLQFDKGSVVFQTSGPVSEADGRKAARAFVDTISRDQRIEAMAVGQ